MLQKTKRLVPVLLILMIGLMSCDPGRIYEANNDIPDGEWVAANKIRFEFDVTDTITPCNVYINVRNQGDYPFSNLYLFLRTYFPDEHFSTDTLQCILANDNGHWHGSGLGDLFYNRFLFMKNIRFLQSGKYVFEMQQAMRTDPLYGIADVGIRIEKAE
jgi:gliding motility-associated lipoprotein GldH